MPQFKVDPKKGKFLTIMSEDGKRGYSGIQLIFNKDNDKSRSRFVYLEVSRNQFINGIKQFALSKEQIYFNVAKNNNLELVKIISRKDENDKSTLFGVIQEKQIKQNQRNFYQEIPFIRIIEIRNKLLSVEILSWYTVTEDNRWFPEFEEFTNFLTIGIIKTWESSRRQLSDYSEYDLENCDDLFFEYIISVPPENFVNYCSQEFTDGKTAKYTLVYEYSVGDSKLPIKTKILYDIFPPDFQNPNWEFLIIARDTIPDVDYYDYARARIRGDNNVIGKIEILQVTESECNVKFFKYRTLPFHDRLFDLFTDELESNFNFEARTKRKKRPGGMAEKTHSLLFIIQRDYEPGMKISKLQSLVKQRPGYENVSYKQVYYAFRKYLNPRKPKLTN